MTKTVLFISHDASRLGAPIVLLNFLKWLKAHSDLSFKVLLREGGELEVEFEALAPVLNIGKELHVATRLRHAVMRRLGRKVDVNRARFRRIDRWMANHNVALIYSNTITNGEVLEYLSKFGCPVISHVHELDFFIRFRIGLTDFQRVRDSTRHYIAVSEAVKDNLVQSHGIPEDMIDTVHEFIPLPDLSYPDVRRQILTSLGIPLDAFIVGASGTTDWRKGSDLFVQLARNMYQREPTAPMYFLWVGGHNEGPRFGKLWHDVKNLGLEKYIRFLGSKSNPLDFFATFDAFAMVSREDPYPLVNLEVASLGKPIVCFDRSGGSKEFVESNCGFVVPYLDIDAMAEKLIVLMNSPELRAHLGQRAMQKVRERHDVQTTAPKLLSIIERFIQHNVS